MSISADLLLSVYGSVLADRSAIYCSAPITSGHRFLDWVRHRGASVSDVDSAISAFAEEHRKFVIEPNLHHARSAVQTIRSNYDLPVIDPTSVPHIDAWKQTDWLSFWETVIGRFAIVVVFVDDWQFSFGCSHEFAFAQRQGIPTYDERGERITPGDGAVLISEAASAVEAMGASATRLRNVLGEGALKPSIEEEVAPNSLTRFVSLHTRCISKTKS